MTERLIAENAALKRRVAELEAELAKHRAADAYRVVTCLACCGDVWHPVDVFVRCPTCNGSGTL